MEINIAILDDHPLFGESLGTIFSIREEVVLVDHYKSLLEFNTHCQIKKYQLFVLDLNLQDGDGRDALKAIQKTNPNAKIFIISSHDQAKIIQNCLRLGADTFLGKTTSGKELLEAFQAIVIDNVEYLNPKIQKILTDHLKGKKISNANFPNLTSREIEVLQLIAEEHTSKEIGEILHLSEFTIEGHRASLFDKFDVKNIAGLMRKAIYAGIVD